MIHNGPEPGL